MFRRTLAVTLVASLAFVPEAVSAFEDSSGVVQIGAIDRQPVLVYDVSGATFLGPVQSTVIVWSSGAVTHSRQEPYGDPEIGAMQLTQEELDGLVDGLADAGAGYLNDQWPQVADLPLHTVTVLGSGTDSAAHTFSYWIGKGEYAPVQSVLDRLKAEVQPVR